MTGTALGRGVVAGAGRFARAAVIACVAAATCAVGAVPAAAARHAPINERCAEPGRTVSEVPWAQRLLGPERVRPFTRGGGQIVAVLDSGVDGSHPQFGGRVLTGFDAVKGSGPANEDCIGTGTQVAGVIAAGPEQSVGFVGLAPDVKILPIRVVAERFGSQNGAEPQVLARGVSEAVARGAGVIAVSAITYEDSPLLQGAVADAVSKGVTVVAAVGDLGDERGKIPTPYPAGYEGVLGVGAIRESGQLWRKSQRGGYVDLVAPGENVLTLSRAGGMTETDGTAVAAGFVAATAVLVRSRSGGVRGGVRRQLERTAVPGPGGASYGSGVVDPYAAVTARLPAASPEPLPDMPAPSTAGSPAWARARDLAMIGTGIAVAAVLVVLVVAVVMPRGRRRFWRAAVAPAPKQEAEPEEPGPPVQLFP